MFKNSKKQGDMGVGQAIAWFTARGHTVCIPLTDSQAYDLVVDFDGLKRVQVKTTACKRRNGYEVSLRVCGGNRSGTGKVKHFDVTEVDLIFIQVVNGSAYLIPTTECGSRCSFTLNSSYDKFRVCMSSSEDSGL